jgi:hypothetical protein
MILRSSIKTSTYINGYYISLLQQRTLKLIAKEINLVNHNPHEVSLCDYSYVPAQEDTGIASMLDLRITRSCLWFNQSEIFYSGSWLWGALIKRKQNLPHL